MTDRLVERYLKQLSQELRELPAARRKELVEEIEAHIGEALAATPQPSEADVRNVLEQVGAPADIAGEARVRFGISMARPGWREWMAVFLLPFGALIVPFLGWVAGVILLWTSRVFTRRDKLIGTFLLPFGVGLSAVWFLVTPGQVCEDTSGTAIVFDGDKITRTARHASATCTHVSTLLIPTLIVLFIVPLCTAIYLGVRLRRSGQARANDAIEMEKEPV
jgi:hypothetical protein